MQWKKEFRANKKQYGNVRNFESTTNPRSLAIIETRIRRSASRGQRAEFGKIRVTQTGTEKVVNRRIEAFAGRTELLGDHQ